MVPFVLASASPARRQLLQAAGIHPIVCPSDFDEAAVPLMEPSSYVITLARGKAEAVAPQFIDSLILGCDSVLSIHGEIHGKPGSPDEAIARWQRMRGQMGELLTGHVLIDQRRKKVIARRGLTQVYFADVSDRQIEAYIATGEPLHCAGCFTLEGRGSLFIEKLVGCHTNVIGLSMALLRQMLAELGYDAVDFWNNA